MSDRAPGARLFALVVATAAWGCRDAPKPDARPNPPAASASASPRTVDQLAPGELAESSETAFGLALPRGMRVERRFGDLVSAKGKVPPTALMSYVKKRVDADTADFGLESARFADAHVKGARPGAHVRIDIEGSADGTVLVVRDTTPHELAAPLGEAETLRRAGLRPDGRQLDPTQLR